MLEYKYSHYSAQLTFSTSSAFVPISPHVTLYNGFFASSATLAQIRFCKQYFSNDLHVNYLSAVSVLPVPGPLRTSQLGIDFLYPLELFLPYPCSSIVRPLPLPRIKSVLSVACI